MSKCTLTVCMCVCVAQWSHDLAPVYLCVCVGSAHSCSITSPSRLGRRGDRSRQADGRAAEEPPTDRLRSQGSKVGTNSSLTLRQTTVCVCVNEHHTLMWDFASAAGVHIHTHILTHTHGSMYCTCTAITFPMSPSEKHTFIGKDKKIKGPNN